MRFKHFWTKTLLVFKHQVKLSIDALSTRPNHLPIEGGALNAGYTMVDALAVVSNFLGNHGLIYRKDWWWEGNGWTQDMDQALCIEFKEEKNKILVQLLGEQR